jgi:hypothetical protein
MRLRRGSPSNNGPERLCHSIPRRSINMSAITKWNQVSFSPSRGPATIFFPDYPVNKTSNFTRKAAINSSLAAQLSFVTDAQGRATELVLHQGGFEQHAKRIDEADAKNFEAAREARIANKTPSPGTEESLRRFVDSMQKGQPKYDEMTPLLAAANRSQVPRTGPLMKSFGALKSLTFRTVNAQGMDVYDVIFEQGRVEFSIAPLTSDGKVTARAWHKL